MRKRKSVLDEKRCKTLHGTCISETIPKWKSQLSCCPQKKRGPPEPDPTGGSRAWREKYSAENKSERRPNNWNRLVWLVSNKCCSSALVARRSFPSSRRSAKHPARVRNLPAKPLEAFSLLLLLLLLLPMGEEKRGEGRKERRGKTPLSETKRAL